MSLLESTEEQEAVAHMVREFAEREVSPTISEYDRKQEMAPTVLPRMAELGIMGINIPVHYGGQGFDYITLGLVCEELEDHPESVAATRIRRDEQLHTIRDEEQAYPIVVGGRREREDRRDLRGDGGVVLRSGPEGLR